MKLYQAVLPLAAAMMIAGCGSRTTAQSVVGQAEGQVANVQQEAEVTAPAELKTVQGTLAHMKQGFDDRDYKLVVNDVPQFNAQMKTLKDAMAAKQGEAATAMQEWSTLNNEVPKAVEEIQARVDSLKPNALPKDVTKEELATAKTDLETMKATWAEATAAASAGNTVEAANKGRTVQAKANELKSTLGMNEQLASVAGTPAGTSK
jgi:predicted  nucleic acid-binding Zn-ribbon protein